MKKYLLTDVCAGLCLLAGICLVGFLWMEHKTNQIKQELQQKPIEVVRKEMLARNVTQGELTMFERSARDMNRFEVAQKVTE